MHTNLLQEGSQADPHDLSVHPLRDSCTQRHCGHIVPVAWITHRAQARMHTPHGYAETQLACRGTGGGLCNTERLALVHVQFRRPCCDEGEPITVETWHIDATDPS